MSRTKRNVEASKWHLKEGGIPPDAPPWAEKHSGNKRKYLRKKKIKARRKERHHLNDDLKNKEILE